MEFFFFFFFFFFFSFPKVVKQTMAETVFKCKIPHPLAVHEPQISMYRSIQFVLNSHNGASLTHHLHTWLQVQAISPLEPMMWLLVHMCVLGLQYEMNVGLNFLLVLILYTCIVYMRALINNLDVFCLYNRVISKQNFNQF